MSSPGTGAARLLRGLWLSTLTVALSGTAHALGGGHTPSLAMLGGLAALLLPACVWVAGRQVRPLTAGALLAAGQLVLHLAFSLAMSCPPAGATSPATGPHAGHDAAAMAVHCAAAGTGTLDRPLLGGAAMLLFHVAATVLVAVAFGGAEKLLWWAWRELVGRLAPAPVLVVPGEHAAVAGRAAAATPALHLRAGPTRRGPPARALLALGASPS